MSTILALKQSRWARSMSVGRDDLSMAPSHKYPRRHLGKRPQRPFRRVVRVYVGRYRDTGASKGFAFVSFEDKKNAPKAINQMNARCYDNLILDGVVSAYPFPSWHVLIFCL